MDTRPTIAVVTRVSRPAHFLGRVLDGLLLQTGLHIHWVIVSQNSLNAAHRKHLEFAKTQGIQVDIINAEKTAALGQLSNIGIRASKSDYILLHDDDDALRKDFFAKAAKVLAKRQYVGIACRTARLLEKDNARPVLDYIISPGWRQINHLDLEWDNIPPISFIFTRQAFENTTGYPENMEVAEDWRLHLDISKQGEIAILSKVHALAYIRDDNTVEAKSDVHYKKAMEIRSVATDKHRKDREAKINSLPIKIKRHVEQFLFQHTGFFLPPNQ